MSETSDPGIKNKARELDWNNLPIPCDETDDTIITVWCFSPCAHVCGDYCVVRSFEQLLEYAADAIEKDLDDKYEESLTETDPAVYKIWTQRMTLREYREIYDLDD